MTTLAELNTSVAALEASQVALAALTDSLKASVDALVTSHGATPEELAVVQARVDALVLAQAEVVARDTP